MRLFVLFPGDDDDDDDERTKQKYGRQEGRSQSTITRRERRRMHCSMCIAMSGPCATTLRALVRYLSVASNLLLRRRHGSCCCARALSSTSSLPSSSSQQQRQQNPDRVLADIADYVLRNPDRSVAIDVPSSSYYSSYSRLARTTARLCLMDGLSCAFLALEDPACAEMLGPAFPPLLDDYSEANSNGNNRRSAREFGCRIPGTALVEADPVQAAFDIGCLVRWLDFNDTWLALEWGHPSDNCAGILAVADYLDIWNMRRRRNGEGGGTRVTVGDVLTAMIQAYEIQGVLALDNSFNRVGFDHVLLVRVATAAVATRMLFEYDNDDDNKNDRNRDDRGAIISAVSNAFLDGGALRTYRHAPNVGSRKSWAAADATSRGVWHAATAVFRKSETGYPSCITAPS